MKKIALCLFGLIRSFEKIYPLILKNFSLNENDELDIFIVTSNFNNKKYRFRVIKNEFLDIKELDKKIRNIVGNKLKSLEIIDERKENLKQNNQVFRGKKIIKLINNVNKYQLENNINYDLIILHRPDILFVTWEMADKYYEQRKEGIDRKNGVLYLNKFKFPIGVKEHGCCSIQKIPKEDDVNVKINLDLELKDNELICYEDYWIGHVYIDFLICNNNLINKILQFWKNYINNKYLTIKRNNKKINSLQTYDALDKKWWLYNDSNINSVESQMRLFFETKKINIKQLRFIQNISVLYIR